MHIQICITGTIPLSFTRITAFVEHAYFAVHVYSHTSLPGPIDEGSAEADHLTGPVVVPNRFEQAQLLHDFFHLSLPLSQTRLIVTACPNCQQLCPMSAVGVNPWGLKALQLWQTDVTHVPDFGRLKYVHVSIDTFSCALCAFAYTREKAHDVCHHFLYAFATLGIPQKIKTDNGPGYSAQHTTRFLQLWGV